MTEDCKIARKMMNESEVALADIIKRYGIHADPDMLKSYNEGCISAIEVIYCIFNKLNNI